MPPASRQHSTLASRPVDLLTTPAVLPDSYTTNYDEYMVKSSLSMPETSVYIQIRLPRVKDISPPINEVEYFIVVDETVMMLAN